MTRTTMTTIKRAIPPPTPASIHGRADFFLPLRRFGRSSLSSSTRSSRLERRALGERLSSASSSVRALLEGRDETGGGFLVTASLDRAGCVLPAGGELIAWEDLPAGPFPEPPGTAIS